MNQFNLFKKANCGEERCGQNDALCEFCQALSISNMEHESITCPENIQTCCKDHLCNMCKATAESLKMNSSVGGGKASAKPVPTTESLKMNSAVGGGKASAKPVPTTESLKMNSAVGGGKASAKPVPMQNFTLEKCPECPSTLGSNISCEYCQQYNILTMKSIEIMNSHLNRNPPKDISYDPNFGPLPGSFDWVTDASIAEFEMSYLNEFKKFQAGSVKLPDFRDLRQSPIYRKMSSEMLLELTEKLSLGGEGYSNSCYIICVLWFFVLSEMWTRINTNTFTGYILYKMMFELRTRLFIGRDIIQIFRHALQKIAVFGGNDFVRGLNSPDELISMLETQGIINRLAPNEQYSDFDDKLSTFVVHQVLIEGAENSSFQQQVDAVIFQPKTNVGSPDRRISPFFFKLCQQKGGYRDKDGKLEAVQQTGTRLNFPANGIFVRGSLFEVSAFTIFGISHYRIVICFDGEFFLADSTSEENNGHYLPVMKLISKHEAMRLFYKSVHTIMFSPVSPSPSPSLSTSQSFSFDLQASAPSMQVDWVPQSTAQYAPVVPVPQSPAQYMSVAPVPQSQAQYAPVAPVPHQSPAQYTSVAPVSQRSAPVSKVKSKSKITLDDIQFHSTKWSCSGKSYSGSIQKVPYFMNPRMLVDVYLFETQRFTDPQKLVEFLNFCESVNQ